MAQIGTTIVPDDLLTFARSLRQRGAKVFLTMMDEDHTGAFPERGCTNCNGGGHLILEYAVTPLCDTPVQVSGGSGPEQNNPVTAMVYKDKWLGKKTKVYNCPACNLLAKPLKL